MKHGLALALLPFLLLPVAAGATCLGNGTAPRLSAPVTGDIVTGFGMNVRTPQQGPRFHTGVDFAIPLGTSVRAAAAGEVTVAGNVGGYGQYIRLRHEGGTETAYAHLSAFDVKKGDCVAAGDVIGRSGNNGIGAMLHFEILLNSRFLDPSVVLQRDARIP